MSHIKFSFSGIADAVNKLSEITRSIEKLENELYITAQQLPPELAMRYQIAQNLQKIRNQAASLRKKSMGMSALLQKASESYSLAEKRITQEAKKLELGSTDK